MTFCFPLGPAYPRPAFPAHFAKGPRTMHPVPRDFADPTPAPVVPRSGYWTLAAMVSRFARAEIGLQLASLRAAADAGFAIWTLPTPSATGSPQTHQVEITFDGVTAYGATADEAACNFYIAAARVTAARGVA